MGKVYNIDDIINEYQIGRKSLFGQNLEVILYLNILKLISFSILKGSVKVVYLEIKDGKFGKLVKEVPADAEVIDYTGYSIAPGLVDTHIHGFGGVDVMDNNIEGTLHTMSEGL